MRLFVGLPLPGEMQDALAALDPGLRGLRWLPAEQLHLTLSFLGEVPDLLLPRLKECLQEVHIPAFFLPLKGLGSFSARGKPSVVWVGTGNGHPHLFALHKRVQDAVLKAGLEADLKPFKPHVTVGRARDLRKEALQPLLKRHHEEDFGLVPISSFILFSSTLAPEGSTYRAELEIPLT